jgi:protein gp37
MRQFTNDYYKKVLPNVWLGTSIENDKVLYRLNELKKVKAAIRFVSFEPLLGPVGEVDLRLIHWAIVGGESGPHHRPIKEEWIHEIRRQCRKYGVAFFFKQWGGLTSKSGGRTLDGRIYDEYPNVKLVIPKILNY